MKSLLQKHFLVLVGWLLTIASGCNSAPSNAGLLRCTTPVPREGKAQERFLLINQRVKEAGPKARVIFVGDSITEGWEGNGKQVWQKYYAPRAALNLGISSDHTEHVLWRLDNGNIEGLKPEVAVVLIGVNNVPDPGNSAGDVLAGVTAVVQKLRSKLPQTKILLLGIFPFREGFNPERGKALQVNQALQKLDDHQWVHYLDIGYEFIQQDGNIPPELMRDFLHPTAAGYKIWAEAMEPKLAALLGEPPIKP